MDVDQPVQFLLALADQRCNLAAECRNVGSLAVSRYAKDAVSRNQVTWLRKGRTGVSLAVCRYTGGAFKLFCDGGITQCATVALVNMRSRGSLPMLCEVLEDVDGSADGGFDVLAVEFNVLT